MAYALYRHRGGDAPIRETAEGLTGAVSGEVMTFRPTRTGGLHGAVLRCVSGCTPFEEFQEGRRDAQRRDRAC